MKYFVKLLMVLSVIPLNVFSFQESGPPNRKINTVNVIPGPEYDAGWLHKLFYGSNWRDLWTTPVNAEVLDLQHFAGGLVPTRKGGGKQTKALRFKGNDGQTYKFRSIDKDAKQTLPQDLQESIAADYLQDQISSAN